MFSMVLIGVGREGQKCVSFSEVPTLCWGLGPPFSSWYWGVLPYGSLVERGVIIAVRVVGKSSFLSLCPPSENSQPNHSNRSPVCLSSSVCWVSLVFCQSVPWSRSVCACSPHPAGPVLSRCFLFYVRVDWPLFCPRVVAWNIPWRVQ